MTVLTQPLALCPAKAIVRDIVCLRIYAHICESIQVRDSRKDRITEKWEGFTCTEYQVNDLFYHEGEK